MSDAKSNEGVERVFATGGVTSIPIGDVQDVHESVAPDFKPGAMIPVKDVEDVVRLVTSNRGLLFRIAHEAHTMGRVYNRLREPESPAEVCRMLKEMIDRELETISDPDFISEDAGT